ncbi:chemotaxis protein CheW [Pseudochryseolinea flava]|uniref:Chemotaxis protein CheW n=1 Tax=Pseudochryseolinea flava TaxID=2059302 RepID=A0A364Y137_9BACT|nr:chemotaxis protein CheW [Pseudochryseolinea flava]RAW00533.1 chemotaxis protein CheW [Pseudochryseolinea flava]
MQSTSTKPEAQLESYLTFLMDNELFAVSVTKVTELLEMLPVTHVPRAPEFMRGVINLRGAVVPVIDTRIKFSLKSVEDTINTCIVVMTIQMEDEVVKVGAIVDAVSEVIEITNDAVLPLPAVGNKSSMKFIQGVIKMNERFIMVLDVDRVFSTEELLSLQSTDSVA